MHIGTVCVDAPRHPSQAKKMQGEEGQIKTDKEEPKVPSPQSVIKHPPRDLRKPEIQSGKHRKEGAADKNIVEVRYYEVGVMHLQIHGYGSQHHAGKSTDQESEEESKAPKHGQPKLELSVPYRRHPAEELCSR